MTKTTEPTSYKSHKAGSRKGETHRIFDTKGATAAEAWGVAQGLQKGTTKSWFGAWRREDGNAEKSTPAKPDNAPTKSAPKASPGKKTGKAVGRKVEKVAKADRQTVEKAEPEANQTAATGNGS
jgi:hypothetical protein